MSKINDFYKQLKDLVYSSQIEGWWTN